MLKSLELNGFKSFAKKTELEFGSSVTAIVGPNGSGKSNVVEAFRFVLGEQSIKSMRGKSGVDLIFKGSKTIAKLQRAKVTIVFDNNQKIFKLSHTETEGEQSIYLDFDTVEITREVFADGTNKYSVNGSEVRLKDLHELLASVHIGSSGHHIISQGQADRLLSANGKERRIMIEDALGLKVYQIKIKEAEKKIEKTEQNIKEVESLRREIAPHLRYLRKQVEKVKQVEEFRNTLAGMYREYLAKQNYLLDKDYECLIKDQTRISDELSSLDKKLSAFGSQEHFSPDSLVLTNIQQENIFIQNALLQKEELARSITRLEVILEMEEKKKKNSSREIKDILISQNEFDIFIRDMNVFLDQASKAEFVSDIKIILDRIKNSLAGLQKYSHIKSESEHKTTQENFEDIKQKLIDLRSALHSLVDTIETKKKYINQLESSIETARTYFYENQRERFEIEKQRAMYSSQQQLIHEKIGRVRDLRQSFEEEIREGVVLVGREILSYNDFVLTDTDFDRGSVDEIRRNIERIKIKIEEAGASQGEEILQEFQEVSDRDIFLERELLDLNSGLLSLRQLIDELKVVLDDEFQTGIQKINKEFDEFFRIMFGGGFAGLRVVKKQSRKKITQEEADEDISDEEKIQEEGVEIEVSLPHKKVKELTMLSGGERSLTSIALLFAMSQVNPPPFLVLDETDAALDEANSRRYGDMIEKLSKYSQLIVVTHNRETMSRAKTLYGVTVGSDGASKLLSIKFNDAEQYAK